MGLPLALMLARGGVLPRFDWGACWSWALLGARNYQLTLSGLVVELERIQYCWPSALRDLPRTS